MSARHFYRNDNWQNEILVCPKCGWSGTFKQGSVEYYEALMDSSCPACDYSESPMLAIVSYTTNTDSKSNLDSVTDDEQAELAAQDDFIRSFDEACLKTASQLPDLSPEQITLSWEFSGEEAETSQTIIRHGEQVVWSEPAIWEGYERFQEVVSILKQKYGDRLIDVVPTTDSELYLYGDNLRATEIVSQARNAIRR